jgi:hypothetical protein
MGKKYGKIYDPIEINVSKDIFDGKFVHNFVCFMN